MSDWYTRRQDEAADLAAQLVSKQRQIQDERTNEAKFKAEAAQKRAAEQARAAALVDQQLAPRKEELRRKYMENHDGYDTGFEGYWARMRPVEVEALREQQLSATMEQMRRAGWGAPPTPATREMQKLGYPTHPGAQMREVGPDEEP